MLQLNEQSIWNLDSTLKKKGDATAQEEHQNTFHRSQMNSVGQRGLKEAVGV